MKLTKMRGKFLRRHGGTILAVVASVGVVALALLSRLVLVRCLSEPLLSSLVFRW